MRLLRLSVPVLAALVLIPAVSFAQEKVESPIYKNWSKFKKGTSVVVKSTSEFAGNKTESSLTTTLIEVADDKVVVEVVSVNKVAGMELKSPPVKQEFAKLIDLPPNVKKEDYGKPAGSYEQGEETVKVSGSDYKTKWYKMKAKGAGNETDSQMWTSDEVPGTIVKMVSKMTGSVAGTMTMELVEVKKP